MDSEVFNELYRCGTGPRLDVPLVPVLNWYPGACVGELELATGPAEETSSANFLKLDEEAISQLLDPVLISIPNGSNSEKWTYYVGPRALFLPEKGPERSARRRLYHSEMAPATTPSMTLPSLRRAQSEDDHGVRSPSVGLRRHITPPSIRQSIVSDRYLITYSSATGGILTIILDAGRGHERTNGTV